MRHLTAAVLVLASLPLFAAETIEEQPIEEETITWYDVELIVFRNLDTRSAETWPADGGAPAVEKARPLFPPQTTGEAADENSNAITTGIAESGAQGTPTPFVPLDESEYQLNGIMDSLQLSSKYEPILHVAWTQPPLERDDAPYLRVTLPGALEPVLAETENPETSSPADNGQPLLGTTNDNNVFDNSNLQNPPIETPEFLTDEDQGPHLERPLDGVVQLSVSRYLHLDLDLIYLPDDINLAVLGDMPAATRQWTEEKEFARERRHRAIMDALARGDITLMEAEILALEPEQDVFLGFRLSQYRRLRSGDIHYFDHPVFGAIVKVTPREVSARLLETDIPRPQ